MRLNAEHEIGPGAASKPKVIGGHNGDMESIRVRTLQACPSIFVPEVDGAVGALGTSVLAHKPKQENTPHVENVP